MRKLVSLSIIPSVGFIVPTSNSFVAYLLSCKALENSSLQSWTSFYVDMNSGPMLGYGSINFSSHPYYAQQGAVASLN